MSANEWSAYAVPKRCEDEAVAKTSCIASTTFAEGEKMWMLAHSTGTIDVVQFFRDGILLASVAPEPVDRFCASGSVIEMGAHDLNLLLHSIA